MSHEPNYKPGQKLPAGIENGKIMQFLCLPVSSYGHCAGCHFENKHCCGNDKFCKDVILVKLEQATPRRKMKKYTYKGGIMHGRSEELPGTLLGEQSITKFSADNKPLFRDTYKRVNGTTLMFVKREHLQEPQIRTDWTGGRGYPRRFPLTTNFKEIANINKEK